MNTRREFFTGAGRLLVFLPAGWAFASALGCGSKAGNSVDAPESECANANKVSATSTAITVTSGCAGAGAGHTHDFTVMVSDLSTPPTAGVSGSSSPYADDNHVHTVTFTQSELTQIQGGSTVMKQSSVTNTHTHVFMFRKA